LPCQKKSSSINHLRSRTACGKGAPLVVDVITHQTLRPSPTTYNSKVLEPAILKNRQLLHQSQQVQIQCPSKWSSFPFTLRHLYLYRCTDLWVIYKYHCFHRSLGYHKSMPICQEPKKNIQTYSFPSFGMPTEGLFPQIVTTTKIL